MTRRIADLTCPECNKPIQVPFEVKEPPTLDEITIALNEATKNQPDQIQKVIQEQLEKLKPLEEPPQEHRHKTADEFLDCPECRLWFDKTATRHQVTPKEPAPPGDEEGKKELAPAAIGSIFSAAEKEGD